ncbi:hypothetical protein B7H27_11880 [Stenotrophomonas maltophilia]|nr:hypothetical protein B7H27_11880 [Stenotrophomonas maltophilia]
MKYLAIVAAAVALTGCATQQALNKPTASGNAEVFIPFVNTEQVRDDLVLRCAEMGGSANVSSNTVACKMQMQGMQAALTQTLIGNSYSTTPEVSIQFTFAKQNHGVFLTAYQMVETQMAFGQVRSQRLTGNNVQNETQAALERVRTRLAPPDAQ